MVVALAQDIPAGLGVPPVHGPLIAEVANPSDPVSTILIVTGRDGAEVVAAADKLSLGSRILGGRTIPGSSTRSPPIGLTMRQPDETDRPTRFGELVDASALQGTGYVPGNLPCAIPDGAGPLHTGAAARSRPTSISERRPDR